MSAGAAAVVALLLANTNPYNRTHVVEGDPNSACLYWPQGTINFYQSQNGYPFDGGAEFGAISRSFQSWQQVMDSCGNLTLVEGPHVADRSIGYDQSNPSANKNIVLFRQQSCQTAAPSTDACWKDSSCGNKYDCWAYSEGTIALTTTTFDTKGGRLFDADIELNAYSYTFTTVDSPICTTQPARDTCVAFDVQNTITHEAGHFLGLDHTDYPGSTMNPTAPLGETSKRTIDSGSQSFVCAVYPKGGVSQACNVSQVSSQLGPSAGCGATGAWPGPWAAGVGLLGLWLSRARRRGGERRAR